MKKLFSIVVAALVAITGFAQSQAPQSVTDAFHAKFPNALNVKWDKEGEHEYEAGFDWNGKKCSANFSDTGEWLETESPLSFTDLPERIKEVFNSTHKKADIVAVAKIDTSKGAVKYEIEFKNGIKTDEVFYSANGTEVK